MLSSFAKLIVKFCQVFRLFCQVFPNISLVVFGDIKGLRGQNLLFDTIPNFWPSPQRVLRAEVAA
jgi:hypothetical protein